MAKRVISGIDVGRFAEALSRPGIDPRVWLDYGEVLALEFDATNGLFAVVQCVNGGEEQYARVGAVYSGPGVSLYAPLAVGDEVIVAYPGGTSASGPVVLHRLHNANDTPPPEAGSGDVPSPDFLLITSDDANICLYTGGAGSLFVKARGSGKVLLGAENGEGGTEPAVMGNELQTFLSQLVTWLAAHEHPVAGAVAGPSIPLPPGVPSNLLAQNVEVK